MMSLKKVLFVFLAALLLAAVAGATPRQASAVFGTSPSPPSARDHVAGYGFGLTVSITDGTSNTVVMPGSLLLSRKAGGGPKEYVRLPESLPAPPFVPIPYPVSSTR